MGMSDPNHWYGMGRLTRDCGSNERDFGYIQNGGDGLSVATISIAVNRSRKKDGQYVDEVSYFDVKIYGKTAENLKPYLLKGQQVLIEGMLKQDRWQDKNTGNNMSKVYINATSVRLVGGKKDNNGYNGYHSANGQNQQPQNNGYQNDSGFQEDIPWQEQEIPF